MRLETYATVAEAARAIGRDGAYFGGGTLLMRAVNAGEGPARLVRSTDPALREIRVAGEMLRLGASVTMAMVLAEPLAAFLHPAARAVGGPQVRAMATVGGNLFAHHPYGDFAVALLALGARVQLAGDSGAGRTIDDVLRDRDRAGPVVTALEVPRPRDARSFAFAKVSRVKPKGASVMSLAICAPREGNRLRGVRLAWGAMGPRPLRGLSVERVLEGQVLDAATITRAIGMATDGLDPPTCALASSWYRREVAGVHLRRLLERIA